MGSLVLVIVLSLHMGRIIGPSHLLSLRGIHLPSGASDVIWSGNIKWSATNQISPCRCTWRPLVKMCWRRWSEADVGPSGERERKPLRLSASVSFQGPQCEKQGRAWDRYQRRLSFNSRLGLCGLYALLSARTVMPNITGCHTLGRLIIASWICLDI